MKTMDCNMLLTVRGDVELNTFTLILAVNGISHRLNN